MEQHTHPLEAAVFAAGMATVYNAEDWDRIVEKRSRLALEDEPIPPSDTTH